MLTECVVPGNTMLDFRRRMDRFFSDFLSENASGWPLSSLSETLPASNIWENKEAWFVEMAAPGTSENQIVLSLVGNDLNIKIERPEIDEASENGKYWRQERITQSQSMTVSLPSGINENGITATLSNGVLLIRLPKNEENKVRKIDVQTK